MRFRLHPPTNLNRRRKPSTPKRRRPHAPTFSRLHNAVLPLAGCRHPRRRTLYLHGDGLAFPVAHHMDIARRFLAATAEAAPGHAPARRPSIRGNVGTEATCHRRLRTRAAGRGAAIVPGLNMILPAPAARRGQAFPCHIPTPCPPD